MTHPLDRPAWSALTTGWARFALSGGPAIQLDPAYGPFAATVDRSPESLAALAQCRIGDQGLWVVETDDFLCPPGLRVETQASVVQMIATDVVNKPPSFEVVDLAEDDAPEMFALARLTKPGPFSTATHRLSQFIGVKKGGSLIAMAGERMKLPGYSELSGVCTHPEHRGQGYGAVLSSLVTRRILDRGETAFLHAYQGNAAAIGLYLALGFIIRTQVILTVLTK